MMYLNIFPVYLNSLINFQYFVSPPIITPMQKLRMAA